MGTKALLFDMNGTMIDDMRFHEEAWHATLNEDLKLAITLEETKKHMYGKNEELFVRLFGKDAYSKEDILKHSLNKERKYQQAFRPYLKLIEGLDAFLEKAHQAHLPMAIGTAAIPFNVDYILDNIDIRHYFKGIVTADDVVTSKPHPEVFLKCAEILQAKPGNCIVFEDSPKGVESALAAGMQAVVLKTYHEVHEFAHLTNVLMFIDDYHDERVLALI